MCASRGITQAASTRNRQPPNLRRPCTAGSPSALFLVLHFGTDVYPVLWAAARDGRLGAHCDRCARCGTLRATMLELVEAMFTARHAPTAP